MNFVFVNADQPEALPLIEKFGVDAIPHMAMVSRDGEVLTALIGEVPGGVIRSDIDSMLDAGNDNDDTQKRPVLPYQMYDAFRGRQVRVDFVPVEQAGDDAESTSSSTPSSGEIPTKLPYSIQ